MGKEGQFNFLTLKDKVENILWLSGIFFDLLSEQFKTYKSVKANRNGYTCVT